MNLVIDERIPWTEEQNMLGELISQGMFECADEFPRNGEKQDVRVVYLMNDAVESFLVFRNCAVTGVWPVEDGGELDVSLLLKKSEKADETISTENQDEQVLVVRQGGTVLTLIFSEMKKEIHLYNYAALGHFWVEGWEYLRNLEYHLAILRDKKEYLGPEYCTELEWRLTVLTEFPPLNYCCYPAAQKQYVVPSYPEWECSDDAIDLMKQLAAAVEDKGMVAALKFYEKFRTRSVARWIAEMFHQKKHAELTDLLMNCVKKGSETYRDREFRDSSYEGMKVQAEKRRQELEDQGIRAEIVREEPFMTSRDSIEYKVYLMIWEEKGKDRVVRIEG